MSQWQALEHSGRLQVRPQLNLADVMKDQFAKRVSLLLNCRAAKCIYESPFSSIDLNSAQTLVLSLIYALSMEDLDTSLHLIHLSNIIQHLKSKYIIDWLIHDYVFERDFMRKVLKTLKRIISHNSDDFPSHLLIIFSALASKYLGEEDAKEFTILNSDSQETFNAGLSEAVRNNNVADILFFASMGADLAFRTSSGGNLYHLAVSEYNVEAITALGFLKANIEVFDSNWETPLLKAVNADSYRMVKALLSCGAKVRRTFKGLNDVFHIATSQAKNKALEALLESGVDVDNENQIGETPLILGVKNRNVTSVRLLLKYGANPNYLLKNGDSLLHMACSLNCLDLVKELVAAGAKLDSKNKDNLIPLHKCWDRKVIEFMISSEKLIKNNYIYSWETLHLAVMHSVNEVLISLLDNGVHIDSKNNVGETPLMVALKLSKIDMVVTLFNYGANTNVKDCNGYTAVYRAAEFGHLEALKMFEAVGSDLNVTLRSGSNLLHAAVLNGNEEITEYLLSTETFRLLINIVCEFYCNCCGYDGKRKWNSLHFAAFQGSLSTVKLLLQYGGSFNDKDNNMSSPLEIAASKGHLEAVKEFLRIGAEVNAVDKYGYSPLHVAAQYGHLDVVKCLIEYDADPSIRTNNGHNAISLSNNQEVKEFLIKVVSPCGG